MFPFHGGLLVSLVAFYCARALNGEHDLGMLVVGVEPEDGEAEVCIGAAVAG